MDEAASRHGEVRAGLGLTFPSPSEMFLSYAELVKPKVTVLNLAVGVICFILAGGAVLSSQFLLFAVAGALVAGGCGAVNCWYDRDIDAAMDRTSRRSIPGGRVHAGHAFFFGGILLAAGLAIMALKFPPLTLAFAATGAAIYLAVYTAWLKRSSPANIVVGGIAGSCAALSGWAAAGGAFPAAAPLFIAVLGFLWTPGHFWSLAIRRSEEYRSAGVPMLPVIAGPERTASAVRSWNLATVIFALLPPFIGLTGPLYLAAALPAGLLYGSGSFRLSLSPENAVAERLFHLSNVFLVVILGCLLLFAFPP